jgi:enoyl-CoA hydratase
MTRDSSTRLELERSGGVATVRLLPVLEGAAGSIHADLAAALEELRRDHDVRVVVMTGAGETFFVPPPADLYGEAKAHAPDRQSDPGMVWLTFNGILRCHHAMAEMEKPIIAKVNGDAIGFGASLAFAADLIVAGAHARFMDHHMGGSFTTRYDGRARPGGHPGFSLPAGDGGALMALYLAPCRMKEYLMLCKSYDAVELELLGLINYAVPESELGAKVDELVAALLDRGAYALAWAKRSANRHVVSQLNLSLDASVGYEMTSLYQLYRAGGEEATTLQ